jgi:thiol-disulfide isomerase/thioredoxin
MAGAPARADSLDDHLEALRVQVPPEPLPAPALALPEPSGQVLRLADLRGKVVFLNFWAVWCVPCREEMPAMERLLRAYRDRGLAIVAVNVRDSKAQVEAFMKELRLSFPAVLDADGSTSRRFAVRGLPVSFLLDREGRILWKAIGLREWEGPHSRAYLEAVLQTQSP